MDQTSTCEAREARPPHYELRFVSLFDRGRGYAFPCDAGGHVAIDALSDQSRINYFFARTVVGAELSIPVVALAV